MASADEQIDRAGPIYDAWKAGLRRVLERD